MKPPIYLNKSHNRDDFDCGVDGLNDYLKRFARQTQEKHGSITYVCCPDNTNTIVGYYTLVFGSIEKNLTPKVLHKGLSNSPIPILLLARLAVDLGYQGNGLGYAMLLDALKKVIDAARLAGLKALIVDAKDKRAEEFYITKGFEFISQAKSTAPAKLYLSTDVILKTLEQDIF